VGHYGIVHNKEDISKHTIRNILTRDFILGFLALFTFVGAMYTLMPALPIYLERLGSSVREIGVLVGVYNISALIFRLLVGVGFRQFSEKTIMMAGALLFAITFLACLTARPFWPFFVVRFMQGSAFSLMDTAALAFVVSIIPVARRGQGLTTLMLAITLALALAPAFGMFIISHYDFASLFLACAGLSLCAFFFSWKLQGPYRVRPDQGPASASGSILEFKIIAPAIAGFMYNVLWGAVIAFVPLYAIKNGVNNPGYFFSSVAVMIIVGRAAGARILDTFSKEKIILTFIFVSMIAMILLSFSKNLPMFIAVGLLWGTGCALFFPAMMTYAFDYAGSSGGSAVGTYRAVADLGTALGPAIMGITISFTGYQVMFICLAVICVVNMGYFQFYLRKRCNVASIV
jgi:predicted MFS family arabinose efflux permease